MLYYMQNCKAHETLMDPSMQWKGLQLSLAWESICTSLSYSREAIKQEVTYVDLCWCAEQSVAVLLLPASPENSGVPSGGRLEAGAQAVLSGFIIPQDSAQLAEICLLP